jgi:TRAP-type C4-dicarboxylate transport system permease small subunit
MLSFFIKTAQAAVTLPDLNSTQDLGVFMQNIYSFSITIVGILIFVRFIWAGWIYLTAAGNSSKTSKANSMMWNAVIGAVLLFSAYLILYVINPDLVSNSFNFNQLLTR